jgi:hypothetical protein
LTQFQHFLGRRFPQILNFIDLFYSISTSDGNFFSTFMQLNITNNTISIFLHIWVKIVCDHQREKPEESFEKLSIVSVHEYFVWEKCQKWYRDIGSSFYIFNFISALIYRYLNLVLEINWIFWHIYCAFSFIWLFLLCLLLLLVQWWLNFNFFLFILVTALIIKISSLFWCNEIHLLLFIRDQPYVHSLIILSVELS